MTSSNLANFALPLPITQQALETAQQFAERQPTPIKAAQVRCNTLAVCVVHDYLQLMGLSTQLEAGDSWSPIGQLCSDVADLEVVGAGKLECRPVLATEAPLEQQACPVPPEVWHDRIGYVVVQLNEAEQKANLLGFVETVEVEELPLTQLQAPEDLLEHLDRLLHPVIQSVTQTAQAASIPDSLTNLGRWLQNTFEAGWQTVESLLSPTELQLAYSFRGDTELSLSAAVRRAKLIDFGTQGVQPLVLLVELIPEPQQTTIQIQLHPDSNQIYLPIDVRLMILDDTGAMFLEASSRETDNYLQLEFSGSTGESFTVQISLADSIVQENFVI
jgi:hypothetical protein